jgi:hypothetical protein
MNLKASSARLTTLLVALVLVVGAWSAAQARTHGLTGNARFQIGDGLPLPIGGTAAPNGKVLAIAGATVMQHGVHTASNPAKLVMDPFQWFYDAAPINIPVFGSNMAVFQVHTNLTYMLPKDKVMFSAGGRTGASTVTFCGQSGSTVTAMGNPACAGGTTGTGLLRYTRTANQFGGPANGNVGGTADVALRGNPGAPGAAPCAGPACVIAFYDAGPAPTGAVGAPFGFTNNTIAAIPNPGAFTGTVNAAGVVVQLNAVLGPGLGNNGTSWGGPWTSGMITASAPAAVPPELFQLTGADGRASGFGLSTASGAAPNGGGTGMLSLVASGFSQRSISGPNANRGWLNMTIGAKTSHIPVMPAYGVAALVALTALSGAYALRRRSRA